MSQEEYDNLLENLAVLSNSELMAKINEGNKQVDAGTTQKHELIGLLSS